MAIKASDLLAHARQLLSFSTEAAYRDVVSRSYYASFHRCLPLAEGLDGPTDGGVHRRLSSQLTGSFDRNLQSLGYMLRQLHSSRIEADCPIDRDITGESANVAVALAERIFARADERADANR